MVARGDIYWAHLDPPIGRRPVCVLTRDAAMAVLHSVTCAPLTRTIRGVSSEVPVGAAEGLPSASVISCDNVLTLRRDLLDPEPIGRLNEFRRVELDQALRFALDIQF